jgi:hypothetical protein
MLLVAENVYCLQDFERLQVAHMLLAAEYGSAIPPLPDWIRGYAESAWKVPTQFFI